MFISYAYRGRGGLVRVEGCVVVALGWLMTVVALEPLAVMTAGAYGAAMSSTYNSRPLVPEVLVRGSEVAVVRPRARSVPGP